MRNSLLIIVGILAYILLSSKSCADGKSETSTREEELTEAKSEIKKNLTSDHLSSETLNALEYKAKQKLVDFSDYLNILSDTTAEVTFRKQSEKMIAELFVSDTILVSNRLFSENTDGKVTVVTFSNNSAPAATGKIIFDSVSISEPIHAVSGLQYQGQLTFSRKFAVPTTNDSHASVPTSMKAEFFVLKVSKTFGQDTLQVWTVKLGEIK